MSRMNKKEYVESKKAEVKALQEKLSHFLHEALQSKDSIQELTAHYRISGLYTYSFRNCILINMQGGTIAQSFYGWKKLKRNVIKGTKSTIKILVPMIKKIKDDSTGEEETKCFGFKLMPVFDIKQTEGKELEYDHNSSDTLDIPFKTVKDALEKVAGCDLVEEFTGQARGYSDGNKMVVSSMSNDTDKVKTAIHECAHHIIHQKDRDNSRSRSAKEIEAESVSALVMSFIGLDYNLSKAYVYGWKDDVDNINTSDIVKTADKIIKELKTRISVEDQFLANL